MHPIVILVLSLVALVAGPLVTIWGTASNAAQVMLEQFVVVVVAGLVLLHILPHSFELCGGWAVGAIALGLVIPGAVHRTLHGHAHGHEQRAALSAALVALMVHATLDGISIAGRAWGEQPEFTTLAAAVVLHRLPMGVAIWWIVRPIFGFIAGATVLLAVAVTTVFGFWWAGDILGTASAWTLGLFQALMGGTLLHVVARHRPLQHVASVRSHPWWAAGGAGVGSLVLVGVSFFQPHAAWRLAIDIVAASAIAVFVFVAGIRGAKASEDRAS